MFDLRQAVLSLLFTNAVRPPEFHYHQVPLQSAQVYSDRHTASRSIAIVGAGSAGLAALKTFLDHREATHENWDIVLFEQRRNVGGIWLPDPNPPDPPELPETPLYPKLRTNTPVPTMTYPGFPFPPMTPLYPPHPYVLRYHEDYATQFNLTPYIRYNHTIQAASWVGNATIGQWNVTIQNHKNESIPRLFDHLVVASGHNHYPHIPVWPGTEQWLANSPPGRSKREILHSIWYREPEKYANLTIVVVGSGASGRDAASQCADKSKITYHSCRGESQATGPVIPKPEISHFTSDAIVFADGTSVSDVDAVILGTGYELRIPFLEAGGTVKINSTTTTHQKGLVSNLRYLFPIHEHIFSLSPEYPTNALAFIGLPIFVSNCPSDIAQSLYATHAIADSSFLPPREDLLRQLLAKEHALREEGYDPYYIGHRLVNGSALDYQDTLVSKIPGHEGRKFVEDWRKHATKYEYLRRGWMRVEESGEVDVWLDGVRSEEEWAGLMKRLNEWQEEWEREHGIHYTSTERDWWDEWE